MCYCTWNVNVGALFFTFALMVRIYMYMSRNIYSYICIQYYIFYSTYLVCLHCPDFFFIILSVVHCKEKEEIASICILTNKWY